MPGEIITALFREWTTGLSPHEQMISIFFHIRDIPYALVPFSGNQISGPEQLLRDGKGSCGPKHRLLGEMFAMLGIRVRYQTWPFRWSDPSLLYPPQLRISAARMDITHHLACRALLNGQWILVDATWDLPLEIGGFPVNLTWDGISDTRLAVHPVEQQQIPDFYRAHKQDNRDIVQRRNGREEFVYLFNVWLNEIRSHP